MGKRYAVSGAITTVLDATFDATGKAGDPTCLMGGMALLGETMMTGRALWLRSVWAYDASQANVLDLFDAATGSNATSSTRRAVIACASGSTTMVDFPAPGLKFTTGCVVSKESTVASGCFQPGNVGGAGYYE